MPRMLYKSLLALQFLAHVQAQTSTAAACSTTIAPKNAAPSVAAGWDVKVVASGLTKPRGITFDSSGHLLVVQQGKGVSSLRLTDDGGSCVRAAGDPTDVIADKTLNHGIELSGDGKTLYASSAEALYSWDYDAAQAKNTSASRQLISGMNTDDHTTRTLLLARDPKGLILVSRGSTSNLDLATLQISSGHSQIKVFNITNVTDTPYDFVRDGLLLGWGLRNSVGMAQEPITGAFYSVENSVDEMERAGQNIHQNNPGEELNFHGYLNGTKSPEQGANYGYPSCFAAWQLDNIPQNQGLQIGTQFAIGNQNATINDTFCREDRVAPRLTFQAHMAPLDLKFNSNGTAAWVSFHGSWNRDEPVGYKLSVVAFANGSPVEPANSNSAAIDVVSNPDNSKCPDDCFRPVGLAFDSKGRLYMSSDATGEIFVVTRTNGGSVNDASLNNGLPATHTGSSASSSSSKAAAAPYYDLQKPWTGLIAAVMALPFV